MLILCCLCFYATPDNAGNFMDEINLYFFEMKSLCSNAAHWACIAFDQCFFLCFLSRHKFSPLRGDQAKINTFGTVFHCYSAAGENF